MERHPRLQGKAEVSRENPIKYVVRTFGQEAHRQLMTPEPNPLGNIVQGLLDLVTHLPQQIVHEFGRKSKQK